MLNHNIINKIMVKKRRIEKLNICKNDIIDLIILPIGTYLCKQFHISEGMEKTFLLKILYFFIGHIIEKMFDKFV